MVCNKSPLPPGEGIWLSSEARDMSLPYSLPVMILGLVVGVGIAMQVVWIGVSDLFRRSDKDESAEQHSQSSLPRYFYITHFFNIC